MNINATISLTLVGFLTTGLTFDSRCQATEVDFAKDVRPLLSDRCFSCHGPDEEHRESEVRFDELTNLLAERGGYRILAPGSPAESEMFRRIVSSDPSEVMPPPETGKPLNRNEQKIIRDWIESGANWKQHWAYEIPKSTTMPNHDAVQGNNWIDHFIADQHARSDASFSEPADTTTLIRRLSFDLVGMPPAPEQVQRILSDDREDTIERYVDTLLSSPKFGERLAMYWLDLVRFADTVGYHGDQDHNISPYRDYVINAINDNLAFDQFTIEQLAGDVLDDPTPEQIVATGYNRLLQTTHEGGLQPREYLAIYAADRVRNVSAVWMGATVGCAQCHDHKFDPYTAHDFYSLSAFFADIDEAQHFKVGTNALPTKRPPETSVLSRAEELQLERLRFELKQFDASANDSSTGEPCDGESATKPNTNLALERRHDIEQAIKQIEDSARQSMITVSTNPRQVRFLPRGNWLDESGEIVDPSVPAFLGAIQPRASRPDRLDLARWFTDSEHGIGLLTARVFVNRIWMLLFGSGLSPSVEDFGGQGEAPTHPGLLDQLAIEFVQSGWDIKHMFRLITSSRTYQQSSIETEWHTTNDPQNQLLSRQNRFRISAEAVRDTALSCSGLMVNRIGGPSVKPYQPSHYYRHLNFPTRVYSPTNGEGQWRRGLYVHWQRQFLHPMLRAFDAPSREECTAKRSQSNTPLAALVWLNDPSFIEAARSLALRVLHNRNDDQGERSEVAPRHSAEETPTRPDGSRIEQLFAIATSRSPDEFEFSSLTELLEQSRKHFADQPGSAQKLVQVGSFDRPSSFSTEEQAAWTMVARAVLNLNETYTRN